MPDRVLSNDARYAVLVGDVLAGLRLLPDGCVHACITSPPYWALRDYQHDGQIGLEPTPEAFVAKMVEVFAEVRRVLHPSGVLALNLGDSYATGGTRQGNRGSTLGTERLDEHRRYSYSRPAGFKEKDLVGIPWRTAFALQADGWYLRSDIPWVKRGAMPESVTDRPSKALEYVFLLSKGPTYYWDMEAVRRPLGDWSERALEGRWRRDEHKADQVRGDGRISAGADYGAAINPAGRNMRNADLWFESVEAPFGLVGSGDELVGLDVTSEGFPGAHFATFPSRLVLPFVLAGTSAKGCCPKCLAPWRRQVEKNRKPSRPGDASKIYKAHTHRDDIDPETNWRNSTLNYGNRDPERHVTETKTVGWEPGCKCGLTETVPALVLDPFAGSGTTLAVAVENNRRAIGCELNPAYVELIHRRLEKITPLGFLVE